MRLNLFIGPFLVTIIWLYPILGFGQQVKNVPKAFESLNSEPEIILVKNEIEIPTKGGHLQGVQLYKKNGMEKLLISGSSLAQAYVLQVDLVTRKTDKLIRLMKEPYRHAGGIQVSKPYMIVGIEDNFIKKTSKVHLYNYLDTKLYKDQPYIIINREGPAKQQTAGATGLLAIDNDYLIVVSNWDSRNWDFYFLESEKSEQKRIGSFQVPDDWAGYQSINLIKDENAIYAIGFYNKEDVGYADLILVSAHGTFELIMEKVNTKRFNGKKGVDFGVATGLHVDKDRKLHIWASQSEASKELVINKFSKQ
jgi:hypothetical protein